MKTEVEDVRAVAERDEKAVIAKEAGNAVDPKVVRRKGKKVIVEEKMTVNVKDVRW